MILVWIFLISEALTSAVYNGIFSLETQKVTSKGYCARSF